MKRRAIIILLILSIMSALLEMPSYGTENDGYTYYPQSGWGFTGGCLVSSYAMLITNAGKAATPLDVYKANGNSVYVYHYVIAEYFGYGFSRASLSGLNTEEKLGAMKELLSENKWGIIVGGKYNSSGSTHYIVARLDSSGKVVYDDPATGGGLDIDDVYGLSLASITTVFMILPDYDNDSWGQSSYAVWQVNTASGINVRKSPDTVAEREGAYPNGTRFNVYETTNAGGYTWGRGDLGWCVLDFCVLANESQTISQGECGKAVGWILYSDGELVIKGSGRMSDYQKEGAPWYQYNSQIKKISVFSGIFSVGSYAFYGSAALSLNLPNSVVSIGTGAFEDCTALTTVSLPESVWTIENDAFSGNSSLTNATVSCSVSAISAGAFESTVVLHGYEQSTVRDYAQENQNTFVSLGVCAHDKSSIFIGKEAPDCTESGFTGSSICSVCGAIITAGEVLAPLGHSYEPTDSAEPDCDTDGYNEYTCEYCSELKRDIIPATGHTMRQSVIPPTTEQGGCTVHACVECGYSYADCFTEPLTGELDCEGRMFSTYLSTRSNTATHDMRFVFIVDVGQLAGINAADIEIRFLSEGGEARTVNSFIDSSGNGLSLYQTVNAAGADYTAAEGYALFGTVVGDIPYDAWDMITLKITNRENGIVLYGGTVGYDTVLSGLAVSQYGMAQEQEW